MIAGGKYCRVALILSGCVDAAYTTFPAENADIEVRSHEHIVGGSLQNEDRM